MTNYKEQTTEGTITKWNRARQIVLENPHDCLPSVMCYETEITKYPDNTIQEKGIGSYNYTMEDPNVQIPLIDLNSFEQTDETFSAVEFYRMAASVYLWLAKNNSGEI